MSRYRVRGMGREFVVIADSETNAVKKLRDSRALKDANAIKDANTSVREWYMRTYPSDKLGKEIRPDLTWYDAYEAKFIYKVADMYRIIGVEDSIVRERIEAQLNRIKKDLGNNSVKDGLTSAEKHNRAMEKIFSNYDNQNNKMAEYLARHGVSSAEIERLRQNTGLHGNALAEKIQKIGKWDDFWKNRDSAIEEEMDIEDLDETIYGSDEYKDSKALKDAVHTTDIDYISADAAKKALEVLKRAGYDAMLKTPTKVIVNTDKDISDFIFNKTDGVFICSNEG